MHECIGMWQNQVSLRVLYSSLTFAIYIVLYVSYQSAIECDAKDATSMHLLGQWCYSVVSVPWYQRQVASVFFATPPQSTYQEVLYIHIAFGFAK